MKLTAQTIAEDVAAIGRCLMTPRADYANEAMVLDRMIREEEIRRGQPMVNLWIKTQRGARTGYILIKPAAGQYQRTLPASVDPNTIPTFIIDPAKTPSTDLLVQLMKLIVSLVGGGTPDICNTNDTIRFDGSELERLRLADHLPVLQAMHAAAQPDYDNAVVEARVQELLAALISPQSRLSVADAMKKLPDITAEIVSQRAKWAASCSLCGWFLAYRDICQAVENLVRANNDDKRYAEAAAVRYLAFGSTPGGSVDPNALIHGLAAKLAREQHHEDGAKLAERYRAEADRNIDQAIAAATRDAHGAALYDAGLNFFVSNRIYKGLAEGLSGAGLDALRDTYVKDADAAEERQVRVSTALLVRFEDRAGTKLARHRRLIAEARAKGGTSVDDMLADFIEFQYFYPRMMESVLLAP